MHTVNILGHIIEHHQSLAYGLIFLGLVFEGEITLISAGVLAHLGSLNLWLVLVFVFSGGFIKTLLGYYVGTVLQKNYKQKRFLKYIERKVLYFIPEFGQKPFWSIFLSKFIMGANYLVVIFSGYKKIDYRTYLKAEITSTIIWAPLLISLGYFFSYTALHISRKVGRFLLIIVTFTIIFLLIDKLISLLYEFYEHDKNIHNQSNSIKKAEEE